MDVRPSPQLQTHVVFFNMTKMADGEFRAIQPQQLYRTQQYGTAIYRAELAWRLHHLGYDISVEKNGAPEIKGYSRDYLEASSPRSQQIREHLKAAGLAGAGPAQIAAHRTREAKLAVPHDQVKNSIEIWRRRSGISRRPLFDAHASAARARNMTAIGTPGRQ
jgi:conjugative relaxase-like TrwC/TraI family protein